MFQPVKVIVHHIRRKVIVYRHTHIHTLTRHINTDYDGPEVNGNGRIIVTEPQYTDMIGPPESPVEVALEWNGGNWVLPSGFAQGDYVVRNDQVYPYAAVPFSVDDQDAIVEGVGDGSSTPALPGFVDHAVQEGSAFIPALTTAQKS